MLRLMIIIPMYAFVVMFLPKAEGMQEFFDTLYRIDPNHAFIASLIGLAIGIGITVFPRLKPTQWSFQNPRKAQVVAMIGMGLFISGVFDIFQKASGQSTNVISLILVPFAFAVAETVFQALDWRLNHNNFRDQKDIDG